MVSFSKSNSEPKDVTPPDVEKLRRKFTKSLGAVIPKAKNIKSDPQNLLKYIPGYEGELSAGLSQGEQDILSQLQSSQTTGLGAQANDYLSSVLSGNYLPGQSQANPFLQATIEAAQRPTLEGLEELLSRTLPGRFTQAGHFTQPQGSSAFDRAAAIATRGVAQQLGDIASQISFGAYEGERQRQQEAVGLSQVEFDNTIKNLQAQGLPRLIEDLGIERGLQSFQQRMDALLKLMATATGTPLVSIGNQQSSSSFGFNPGGLFTGVG